MISKSKKIVRKNMVENAVVYGVLKVLDSDINWIGTMTDLSDELVLNLNKQMPLPRSPSALRAVLNRVANRLRSRGVSVKFGRTTDHSRTRYVKFVL